MSDENTIYESVEKITKLKPRLIATHVGKFSHPDVKINIYAQLRGNTDGFLRSGNVENTELDSPGDAATLGIAKFMFDKLGDGKSVYQHLQQNTNETRDYLSIYGSDYASVRDRLRKLLAAPKPEEPSSGELKQVYFPVDNNYHLLSILVPVGIVLNMHEKLKEIRFADTAKASREARKKSEYNADGHHDIWGLTTISYGGANAQNISYLATKLKGCCLLPCLPPKISKRAKLPKRNFFTDVLWIKNYEDIFNGFHKLQAADWNKKDIRQGRDRWITSCLDRVMDVVWRIRGEEAGWSDHETYKNLRSYQKKWLDNKYCEEREASGFDAYATEIINNFARWFMGGYANTLGSRKTPLGDDFFIHVKSLIDISWLR